MLCDANEKFAGSAAPRHASNFTQLLAARRKELTPDQIRQAILGRILTRHNLSEGAFTVYGLVNAGIQTFIEENFGRDDWLDICQQAELSDTEFEGMLSYPDDVTYTLVGVISKKYGLDPSDVLHKFGHYWVGFAENTDIGKLLRFSSNSFVDRLESLNDMLARIKMSMPHLAPPVFEFEEGEDGRHKLHYGSDREGLENMVIGLVEKLGTETGQAVKVTKDPEPMDDEYRATFTIEILPH